MTMQNYSLFPKHLRLNGEVGEKLKELISIQEKMRSFSSRD